MADPAMGNQGYPADRETGVAMPARSKLGDQLDSWLLGCVDAGLAAAILAVPLAMGGRTALGQLILVALATWVAGCWCLRQSLARQGQWTHSLAEPLLLAAVGLLCLQIVPLPSGLLAALSPHIGEILPLWAADSQSGATLGVWKTLSLTPDVTRESLFLVASCVLLFVVTAQRVRRVADVERLIRWVAISASMMAVFGIVQFLTAKLTDNGKFFWFFQHPYSDTFHRAKGAFTNANHFAHFLALGFGSLVWWVQNGLLNRRHGGFRSPAGFRRTGGRDGLHPGLTGLLLAICVFALLLSQSRGGAMAMGLGSLACVLILWRGSLINARTVLILVGMGAMVWAGLQIYGREMIARRLDDFASIEDLDSTHQRRNLWKADLQATADYRLLGTGLSSHRQVYPMYFRHDGAAANIQYTHAENGPLQVLLETGILGLGMVLIGIVLFGTWCFAPLRHDVSTRVLLCLAAIAPCLVVSVVHSMVDFVWYVPGCMVVVVILAACGCRLWQMTGEARGRPLRQSRIPRGGWVAGACGLAILGGLMVEDRLAAARAEPHWFRYLAEDKAFFDSDGQIDRLASLASMEEELSQVLKFQPNRAVAHARKAEVHLMAFNESQLSAENSFHLRDIRETALSSGFSSSEALHEWLSRAVGPHRRHLNSALYHARRAVSLGPLQGEEYICLAQLAFLEGPHSPGKSAYVEQASKVRPFDGAVLFEVGEEAICEGMFDDAIRCWQGSFQCGLVHQKRILQRLGAEVSADYMLQVFQPDLAALALMTDHYVKLDRPEDLRCVQAAYAAACEKEAKKAAGGAATNYWLTAAALQGKLENIPAQLECLEQAVDAESTNYAARLALGKCYYSLHQFARAEEHLKWCSRSSRADQALEALLEQVVKKRISGSGLSRGHLQAQSPYPPARR